MSIVKNIQALLACFCIATTNVLAVQIGSESCIPITPSFISLEPYALFPSSGTDNRLLSFGYFKNGFGLQDAKTSCTFSSIFPVSGQISLHGGKLYLDTDLICQNFTNLATPGTIFGQNHVLDFSQSITGIPTTFPANFDATKLFLNTDLALSGTVNFTGNCLIDGRWNSIVLNPDAHIIVGHNSSLELRNVELYGVSGSKLRCLDNSGQLTLDSVRWIQDGEYSFTSGSMLLVDDVNCVGPYNFNYASSLTSTIASASMWHFSDIVQLTLGRKNGFYGREPLHFTDGLSILKLENCTLNVTSSGARLTKGLVLIDGEVKLDIKSTHSNGGLYIGDGQSIDDLVFQLYPGAVVNLIEGHFINDIMAAKNFLAGDVSKKFIRQQSNTYFYSNQNINFSNVDIILDNDGITTVRNGKTMTFDNCFLSSPAVDFYVTGTRFSSINYVLDGDGLISLVKGALPLIISVYKTGNLIRGTGDMTGPIILADGGTELTTKLDGSILYDMTMYGGKLILNRDLRLGKDVRVTGSGTVDLASYEMWLRLQDALWTSTITFKGNAATINLGSDFRLASPLKISGNCTINGNGNELKLLSGGNLIIAPNATLNLKNILVTGVQQNNIRCNDNSGSIIFDNTKAIFSGAYSFTTGSLMFKNAVECQGNYTFSYASCMTSTIAKNSLWQISDGMRLYIGRQGSVFGREPLYMTDLSSIFEIDGSTLAVSPFGMRLTRGSLWVSKTMIAEVNSTNSTNGLIFGDKTPANDMRTLWSPAALAKFSKGHFVFEVTVPTNFQPKVAGAKIQLIPGVSLYINQDLTLADLDIVASSLAWNLIIASGKSLNYQNTTFDLPGIKFDVTGKRYNLITTLLAGNNSLISSTGVIPLNTLVQGSGNSISGFGGVAGLVTLQDSKASLDFGIGTAMLNNIVMNGGKVSVSKPILFADDMMLTGSGSVSMSNKYINIGGGELQSTSTIYWNTNGAYILLRSNLALSSKWTFSGKCTISSFGGSASIILNSAGLIEIERGSQLTLKGITVAGLSGSNFYCKDNAGKVIFDDASLIQQPDSNFTFSLGSFNVVNSCDMDGRDAVFYYQSNQQSLIKKNAELKFDPSFTFYYAPLVALRDRLIFEDATAELIMDNATLLSTATGIQLTKGLLTVQGHCTLGSDATYDAEGIIFGDGSNPNNDLNVDIFPESTLELAYGHLRYKNVL